MKKLTLATLMISSLLSASAFAAGYNGPATTAGGYSGPVAAPVNTVAGALNAPDDSNVILEGNITQRLQNHEHYEFRDDTGTIVVEIDNDDWPYNAAIDENTKVRLYGEIDRDPNKVDIDVDRLEIIQ